LWSLGLFQRVLDLPPGGESVGVEGCEHGRDDYDPDGDLYLDRGQINPPDKGWEPKAGGPGLWLRSGRAIGGHRPEQL
jgi:hypothetical protein